MAYRRIKILSLCNTYPSPSANYSESLLAIVAKSDPSKPGVTRTGLRSRRGPALSRTHHHCTGRRAADLTAGGEVSVSRDDAPMFAGQLEVSCDRSRRRELKIALHRQARRTACDGQFLEAHIAELRLPNAKVD